MTHLSARVPFDLDGVPPEVVDAYHLDRLPLRRPLTSTADLLRLDGKVALVTGGGGNGLGNAICHRLAEQGAAIAVLDVDAGAGADAADDLARTWGVPTATVTGNVADWDSAHDAVRAAAAELGTIDILVNNAGGGGAVGASGDRIRSRDSFAEMDRRDIETTIGVNFLGVLHVTRAALEIMRPRRSGRIINIASEGGRSGSPVLAVYGSCKAAVINLTQSLAHELGPEGITVASVCPATLISDRLVRSGALSPTYEGLIGWAYRRTTIGRLSLPDEVASVVAFLASDAGGYVHGSAVSVSGGFAD